MMSRTVRCGGYLRFPQATLHRTGLLGSAFEALPRMQSVGLASWPTKYRCRYQKRVSDRVVGGEGLQRNVTDDAQSSRQETVQDPSWTVEPDTKGRPR